MIIYKNIFIYTYIIYHYIIHDCTHIKCQKDFSYLVGWFIPTIPVLHFINWNALVFGRLMPRMPGILMDALDLEIPTRWRSPRWELEYWGRWDLAPWNLEHFLRNLGGLQFFSVDVWRGVGWCVFLTISCLYFLFFNGKECWPGTNLCVPPLLALPKKWYPPKFNMAPKELPSLPGKG